MLFFLPIIFFIVFFVLFLWLLRQDKRKTIEICIWLFVISIFGGFTLYTYGYFLSSDEGLPDALFSTTFGMYNTFRMFFNEHDYEIAIQPEKNHFWHILFWLFHLVAIMAVNAIVLNLFGRKLIDEIRMRLPSKEIYIIKGNDENALLLGNNIITHDGGKPIDPKRLIIFWLEQDDDEKKMYKKAMRFGGIVKVLDSENSLLSFLKEISLVKNNCILSFHKKTKYKVIIMPNDISVSDDAYRLVKLVKEKSTKEQNNLDIFIITPSEWEKKKIETIIEMKNDNGKKIFPFTFHLINEIDLITRQMIEKLPPYACPGLNFSNGIAKRDFNVMILGFGTMGQAALLRLIMNGQFVGSKMHAIVIDKNIDKIEDYFKHCYPELEKLSCSLDYQKFNIPGESFFNFLNKKNNIDYIVIALNDDEINKKTALEIRFHYLRNGLKLPFIAIISDSENNDILPKEKEDEKIFIFGCRETLYRESVIIDEETDLIAKAVNNFYNKGKEKKDEWEMLDLFSQESNRATADFIDAMLFLEKGGKNVSYKATEFMNNKDEIRAEVSKRPTLTDDKALMEIIAQTEHLRWCAFHAAMGWQRQSINIFEKLRFIYDKEKKLYRKNLKAKLHIGLVPWDKLDEISDTYYKITKEKKDFKDETYNIINNIPEYLRGVESSNGGKNV